MLPASPAIDVALQAEELAVELEGHRLRCLRAGAGPALLLIHGLLGYSFSWRFNLQALSRVATVYAVDMLGTGYSDRPRGLAFDLRSTAERMLKFLSCVNSGPATVLGTSHGGGVAVMMAAIDGRRATRQVRRLVLPAPVNPWSRHGRLITRTIATVAGSKTLRALFPFLVKHTASIWLRRMYGDSHRISPGTLEGYVAPVLIPGVLDYALAVAACWNSDMDALEDAYQQIADLPTLLIWGSRDTAVFARSAAEIGKRLRASELRILKGAGHLPYEECPEQFNRLVTEFLERAPSRGGAAAKPRDDP